MQNIDFIVTAVGVVYGFVLIMAAFTSNKFTDSMRIDALLIPQPTESTRPLNLIFGLIVAGYGIYSLLSK